MPKRPILFGLAAASIALAAGCDNGSAVATPKGEIKIGVDLTGSGVETSGGTPSLNGVRFAVSQTRSLDGFTLSVLNVDDLVSGGDDPVRGALTVRRFVDDPKVLGLIGPLSSEVARAQIPITNQAHLVQISTVDTTRCLAAGTRAPQTQTGLPSIACTASDGLAGDPRPSGTNNYFKLATTNEVEGPAMADYAVSELNLARVGVASDADPYGKGIADTFSRRFTTKGGLVVKRQDFSSGADVQDVRSFLRAAVSAGAQGIYFGGTDSGKGCLLLDQMDSIFPADAPFIGGYGTVTGQCPKNKGGQAPTARTSVAPVDANSQADAKPVIDAFKNAYPNGSDYGPYTMASYDATKILIAAIGRAIKANGGNMPSRQQVLRQMYETDYSGVLGHTSFDSNGATRDRVITIYMARWASNIRVSCIYDAKVLSSNPTNWTFIETFTYTNGT